MRLLARIFLATPLILRLAYRLVVWNLGSGATFEERLLCTPGAEKEYERIKKWVTA